MSGGYKVTRSGRAMEQNLWRIWDVSNAYYIGGPHGAAYTTYEEAAAAAAAQEAADRVARVRAGLRTRSVGTGRVYARR